MGKLPFIMMRGKEVERRLFMAAENNLIARFGFTSTPIEREFTDKELNLLDVKRDNLPFYRREFAELYPRRLSCHSYVFLKAREQGIRESQRAVTKGRACIRHIPASRLIGERKCYA